MILKHIKIQGLHGINKEYDLERKIFFKGANGSGKSTILQAIQWALLGYIPGTNKTNAAMFGHCVGPAMSVTLNLEYNGTPVTIYRQLAKLGNTVNAQTIITPELMKDSIETALSKIELPIFNFSEFAGMTANKLKDWFIDYLPKTECNINWNEFVEKTLSDSAIIVPDDSLPVIRSLYPAASGIDAIRTFNASCKSAISAYTAESKRLASTMQSVVTYDGDDVSITELRGQLAEVNEKISRITAHQKAVDANAEANKMLERYSDLQETIADDTRNTAHAETIVAIRTDIAGKIKRKDDLHVKYAHLNLEFNQLKKIADADGVCPMFSDVICATVAERRAEAADKLEGINTAMMSIENELMNLEHDIQVSQNAIDTVIRNANALITRYNERDFYRTSLRPVPDVSDIMDFTLEQYEELRDELNKQIGQIENAAFAKKLVNDKMRVDTLLAAFKALEKASGVNGLQSKIASPFIGLRDSMFYDIKTFFGRDAEPEFIVTEKANSFSFGISRNGEYVAYEMLSSGEKAMFCLALMVAIVSLNDDCKLLMIDDMFDHVDKANMEKIQNWLLVLVDIQCIMAGVNPITTIVNQEVN